MNEEQFKQNYKKAVDHMKTNEQMKKRVEQSLNTQHQGPKRQRKPLYIAASVVIAASIGLAAPSVWQQFNGPAEPTPQVAEVTPGASFDPIVIPKMELSDSQGKGAMADMMQLVVYGGNVYTQSPTLLDSTNALSLRGDKLGTTTGGINELSGQDKYTEFASNIGEADIYAVNGYDKDFRIMSYTEIDGQVYAQLFDKNNGITIGTGADLIGKLHLEGNVASAQWETFDSWNNGKQQFQPLAADESLESFISALSAAKPIATSPELEENLYGKEDRKIIYLTLKDKTQVPLVLFGEGLVRYGNVPAFLEVEKGAFQAFWSSLGE
ncbi:MULTISPECIES: hypothetical protein [unclassified Paenibacillus]|uniref:hypothetical protein n=1 Tax=unclassified Paenibacillus TaxID=185978 RepID=UPI000CFDA1CC|nr:MULTISPECIES: hypothetical protein [unclassified Paenibacillus]PRA07506.1 hypothetical protein CQ043_08940 [Paenibacillus sp. MYb63]PRA51151.1 hypothetical protein CQ061_02095 [Paenibacillus sp. MYb67]QZN74278.1 hypothetical protein K5K90_23060 [Paenibacillus sp. DR312]